MPAKSNRPTLIAVLFIAVAIGAVGLWLWRSGPRREILFRSNVGNNYELLIAYQDTKGRLDADRLMFGDVSGTLSYAFVKDGSEPKWIVEVAELYPDAYRGFELIREANADLILRDVARGYSWTVDVAAQTLRRIRK